MSGDGLYDLPDGLCGDEGTERVVVVDVIGGPLVSAFRLRLEDA